MPPFNPNVCKSSLQIILNTPDQINILISEIRALKKPASFRATILCVIENSLDLITQEIDDSKKPDALISLESTKKMRTKLVEEARVEDTSDMPLRRD